jgi:hypothetical protein
MLVARSARSGLVSQNSRDGDGNAFARSDSASVHCPPLANTLPLTPPPRPSTFSRRRPLERYRAALIRRRELSEITQIRQLSTILQPNARDIARRVTMVRFKNFECMIKVDGVALPEYTDPEDAGDTEGPVPTAVVYIQSEEGKPFSIKFSVLDDVGIFPEANAVCWHAVLDGNKIKLGWICDADGGSICVHGNKYRDSNGRWFDQDFLFSKLDVTEDDAGRKDSKDTSSLGEIEIGICRYKITGPSQAPKSMDVFKDASGVKSLHEKQLKGRDITHSVG